MNSYNKLKDDKDIIKYYKTVLSEMKTKRFRTQNANKIKFLDEEIIKLEKMVKELCGV